MDPHVTAELVQATGAVAAAARLISAGLRKRFPALLAYLVFLALINLVLGLENAQSLLYFYSWVILEPLKCVFSVIAVRELFALTFDHYPGIRTAGRWAMYAGVVFAASISIAATIWAGGVHGRSKIFYFEAFQRSVIFTLAFVIGAILWSLSRYPLHLQRNTLVSSACFSALFLGDACRLFIDSLADYLYNLPIDRTESVFACLCLLTWAALLKPEIETTPARVSFPTPQEDHLLQQLNALNQLMTRAARR